MTSIFSDFNFGQKSDDDNNSGSTSSKGGTGNLSPLSPYLNFDPHYIPKMQPEFIYPDENYKAHTTKRTSVALPQIGASCIIGAGLGGAAGLYNGLKATTLAGQAGKIRRTQILNYVMKQGSATSCTLGIIASFYSVVGVGVSYARDKEDSFNTFLAAGTTGALYKSTAGARGSALGAAVGVAVAAVYTLATSADDTAIWGKFKRLPM